MQIPSTNSVTAATSAQNSASRAANQAPTLAYNEFLTLLVAEMQNQDPTKPMDPTQTVSQLASFSAVEQAVQTNATLTSILNSAALSQASSFIGKTITSSDGTVSGVVVSVTSGDSGLTATLANGGTLSLAKGISVS